MELSFQLRLPQLWHLDWPDEAEAIRKLSKRCQNVVTNQSKTLSTRQRHDARQCNIFQGKDVVFDDVVAFGNLFLSVDEILKV